jgi:hypothetical protein
MIAEFLRPDDEEKHAVATATWDGHDVTVTAGADELRAAVARAFRRAPVAVDDASYRQLGTHGSVVIQPGGLEWFRAAAQVRAVAETGLLVRLVPGVVEGGYDPAAGYRRFEEQIERLDARTRGATS